MPKGNSNINELDNLIDKKLDNLIITMPEQIAKVVGLQYVSDNEEGYRRKPRGKGFIYLDSSEKRITDKILLERFESLIIPPAWGATVLAAKELKRLGPMQSETDGKKKITETVKAVSTALNNTPSVCRKYYIHPEIITSFTDGSLFEQIQSAYSEATNSSPFGLDAEESAVLNILRTGLLEKEQILNSA
ncbi:MAG: hypothetical protein ACM3MI_10905 [Clostridiales bacterium]